MGIFSNIVYKDGEIVDNGWIKWMHFGVPDEEGAERETKKTISVFYALFMLHGIIRMLFCRE